MDKLYIKILDAFKSKQAVFTDAGLVPPKFIDLYRGQPQEPEQFDGVVPYSIFIEYAIDWRNGLLTLSVHVLIDMINPTNSRLNPDLTALKMITYYQKVHEVLNGLSSDNTGKLERTTETPQNIQGAHYQIITYEAKIYSHQYTDGTEVDGSIEEVAINKQLLHKFTL